MHKTDQLEKIREYVKNCFQTDVTGHDYQHMERVWKAAKWIAEKEQANSFICEVSALVHDIGDHKLFHDPASALDDLKVFMQSINIQHDDIAWIMEVIRTVSFSKGALPTSLEGKVVQDADRLDAIGAIGIARTFAYGGTAGQPIYSTESSSNSIQHFYDKLLKLKDYMHTDTAKQIAEERHAFMYSFLKQFHNEWKGIQYHLH